MIYGNQATVTYIVLFQSDITKTVFQAISCALALETVMFLTYFGVDRHVTSSSVSALLLRSGCEHILILVVVVILWFPLIQFNVYFLRRVCCFSVRCLHCCSSRLEVEVEMLSNGGYRNE